MMSLFAKRVSSVVAVFLMSGVAQAAALSSSEPAENRALPTVATTPAATSDAEAQMMAPLSNQNLSLFGNTLQAIREVYVKPVSDDVITENAARGMLSNLDPHSDYLDASDFQALKTMTEGEFCGIGVEITAANGAILVITPIDDSPASKAGILAGDYITKINDISVEGLSLTKAMNMMRGKKGGVVRLVVVRKGVDAPLTFKVVRDNIILKDVRSQVFNDHYAYLRISAFGDETGAHAEQALLALKKPGHAPLYGLILDLRNNPGGVVTASVDVSNLFLNASQLPENKGIVSTKGRFPGAQYTGELNGKDELNGLPLIVLINAGTASAAEIVAGALQDYHRAILVGVRSFGKGSVQTVFPLQDDETAIKLTTALYYTPNGRLIQARGITPDVAVNRYSIPDTVKPLDDDVIREDDLADHLSNPSGKAGDLPIRDSKTDGEAHRDLKEIINKDRQESDKNKEVTADNAFYKDFQLYQALNILSALHALPVNKAGS